MCRIVTLPKERFEIILRKLRTRISCPYDVFMFSRPPCRNEKLAREGGVAGKGAVCDACWREACGVEDLTPGLMETLAIEVSPESRRGLAKAEEDLAAGRTRSHAEVWGNAEDVV